MIEVTFRGKKFKFNESPTAQALVNEIYSDNYRLFEKGIEFRADDIILDIGANEGMFSILMAKFFPTVKVIALEPVPRTFMQMIRNIALNDVMNIFPHCLGVGPSNWPEGNLAQMNVHRVFSGGSSLVDTFDPNQHEQVAVRLASIDGIKDLFKLNKIRLLKIDIEGGEYQALKGSKILKDVDYMVGEFHINQRLINQGHDIRDLATLCGSQTNLLYYESCKMAE